MEKEQLIALVQKSQSGDLNAMEKLLQYAHTSVSYQCRKMLRSAQDAEDMTQEVLVTIYTKLDTLQEPAAFHKWVNQIASSRCINALNRTHVEYQFAEDEEGHSILDTLEELDEQVIPDKAIDNAETVRMIEEIVGSLPDAQRAATLMFYYNEMSVKEIAQTMNVSENTVKSRLNYARKAIKEKVLDYEQQGIKLYGLSPLPFLLYFLRLAAQSSADKKAAGAMVAEVLATGGAATAVAAGTTGAAAAAGSVSAGVAAASSSTVATGVFAGISAKVVAGVLAAVVAIGSVVAVVIPNTQKDTAEPGIVFTEATEQRMDIADNNVPTDETTETPTEESTEATTETPTEESEAGMTEPVHEHSYERTVTTPPTCSYGGEATYTCSCGHTYTEAVPKNEHVWSEWVVVREPTATTYGQKVRECELCHGAQFENIDPLPPEENESEATEPDESEATHTHTYTETVTAPTCVTTGYTTYTCFCGDCYIGNETEALGHIWGEWFTVIPPTVDAEGLETRTCNRDGCYEAVGVEQRVIPKLSPDNEHTCEYEITDFKAHSCTEGGYTTVTCTICGDTQTQYKVAMGHNYVDGVCTYCGETTQTSPSPCAHRYDGGQEFWPAGTMTWEPYILYTCTLCGHTYTELIDYIP